MKIGMGSDLEGPEIAYEKEIESCPDECTVKIHNLICGGYLSYQRLTDLRTQARMSMCCGTCAWWSRRGQSSHRRQARKARSRFCLSSTDVPNHSLRNLYLRFHTSYG